MNRKESALLFAVALAVALPKSARAADLPTQSFRNAHTEVKQHLEHVAGWAGRIGGQQPAERKRTAEQIVAFFEQHIVPHAQWEEKSLYPLVDRLAATSEQNRLTSTMRYEHRVVGRWIGELRREVAKSDPDYLAFARQTDNLLGLVRAHFEEEEEVLLPYADRQMSRAQFEAAVEPEPHR